MHYCASRDEKCINLQSHSTTSTWYTNIMNRHYDITTNETEYHKHFNNMSTTLAEMSKTFGMSKEYKNNYSII